MAKKATTTTAASKTETKKAGAKKTPPAALDNSQENLFRLQGELAKQKLKQDQREVYQNDREELLNEREKQLNAIELEAQTPDAAGIQSISMLIDTLNAKKLATESPEHKNAIELMCADLARCKASAQHLYNIENAMTQTDLIEGIEKAPLA